MNCDCIFHDFAIFTRVQIDVSQEFCNRFKSVKIVGNSVVVSEEVNIGDIAHCQPIERSDTNKSVEQHFLEVCHEMEQSYHRLNICFENVANLMIDESPTNLQNCIIEFIERMINEYMPLGILNSVGLINARNVLNEIHQSLNQPNSAAKTRNIVEKSNQFYQMIPHIEFNFNQPRKLPPINTSECYRSKMELIDHLEAVSMVIQTGRQMENRNLLEFIYGNFMGVQLKTIPKEHSDFGEFKTDFGVDNGQPIKILMKKQHPPMDFAVENSIGNVHYLFHATHLADLIDILREGLRIAPQHVFSYNRWYGRGIYFYGDFKAAHHHAERTKQKIILVCRVALGNVEILQNCNNKYTNSSSLYPLQSDKNSLRAFGSTCRSTFEFNESYRAFLPRGPSSVVSALEALKLICKSSYRHNDEFVVQHANQAKIEYIIELND